MCESPQLFLAAIHWPVSKAWSPYSISSSGAEFNGWWSQLTFIVQTEPLHFFMQLSYTLRMRVHEALTPCLCSDAFIKEEWHLAVVIGYLSWSAVVVQRSAIRPFIAGLSVYSSPSWFCLCLKAKRYNILSAGIFGFTVSLYQTI